jgi:hypothetical protein
MKWRKYIGDYFFEKFLTEAEKEGLSPKDEGFFDACVRRMKGKVDDPEAYCASIKDTAWKSTFWRGKGKTRKEAEKAVAKND